MVEKHKFKNFAEVTSYLYSNLVSDLSSMKCTEGVFHYNKMETVEYLVHVGRKGDSHHKYTCIAENILDFLLEGRLKKESPIFFCVLDDDRKKELEEMQAFFHGKIPGASYSRMGVHTKSDLGFIYNSHFDRCHAWIEIYLNTYTKVILVLGEKIPQRFDRWSNPIYTIVKYTTCPLQRMSNIIALPSTTDYANRYGRDSSVGLASAFYRRISPVIQIEGKAIGGTLNFAGLFEHLDPFGHSADRYFLMEKVNEMPSFSIYYHNLFCIEPSYIFGENQREFYSLIKDVFNNGEAIGEGDFIKNCCKYYTNRLIPQVGGLSGRVR